MAVHNGARMLPSQLTHLLAIEPALVPKSSSSPTAPPTATPRILAQTAGTPPPHVILRQPRRQIRRPQRRHRARHRRNPPLRRHPPPRPARRPRRPPSNFADPTVGCVAGELLLNADGHSATASAVSGLYWRYEQCIRNCEAAVDSPVGVYGGFYAIRRALATPFPPGLILDDMFQPLSIIRQGYRSVLDRTAFVLDTWPAQTAGEFSRKVRTLAGNFQLIARAPWLLTPANRVLFQLVSHKLLRLAVPYFFLTLLLSSILLGALPRLCGLRRPPTRLLAHVRRSPSRYRIPLLNRIATPASAMLVLNVAAVAGLYKFLFTRGPLWKIWSPTPASPASPSPGTTAYTPPPSSPA